MLIRPVRPDERSRPDPRRCQVDGVGGRTRHDSHAHTIHSARAPFNHKIVQCCCSQDIPDYRCARRRFSYNGLEIGDSRDLSADTGVLAVRSRHTGASPVLPAHWQTTRLQPGKPGAGAFRGDCCDRRPECWAAIHHGGHRNACLVSPSQSSVSSCPASSNLEDPRTFP